MAELITTGFDYESVDLDTKGKLEYFSKSAHALRRKLEVEFIAKFGEILSEARKVLAKPGEGTFIKWSTLEFDISKDTVYRYLNAWDRCLSHCATDWHNLSVSALYLISSDKTPTSLLPKAIKLAAKQSKVSKADIVRLIEANSRAEKPNPEPPKPAASSQAILDEPDDESNYPEIPDDSDSLEPDDESNCSGSLNSSAADQSQASIVLDDLGRHVPAQYLAAHQLGIVLMKLGRDVDVFRQKAKELADEQGGEFLRLQEIDSDVRSLKGHFQQAKYHTICPQCKGKGGTCKKCDGAGWLPDYLKGTI